MPPLVSQHVRKLLSVGILLVAAAGSVSANVALQDLQLTGILAVGNEVQVCLLDPQSSRAAWLKVGEPAGGLWAESFDPESESVVLRAGASRRTVSMREAKVSNLPVAYLPDGSVDWFHMQLSEKEKEREANLLMWDVLEVGRLARLGRLAATEGRGSK